MLSRLFRNSLHKNSSRRRATADSTIGGVGQTELIQQLEDRTLLSGNVVVRLSDAGVLDISGDAADNQVSVVVDENGGVRAVGLNGTTVNGQAEWSRTTSNVHSIIGNMREGNDELNLFGVESIMTNNPGHPDLGGQLWVNMASGDDSFFAQDLSFGLGAAVYGQDGAGAIFLQSVDYGTGFFSGGEGDDSIVLNDTSSCAFTSVLSCW